MHKSNSTILLGATNLTNTSGSVKKQYETPNLRLSVGQYGEAYRILGRASNLIGVLHIVAEMATIRKTLLISLKSRLCKDTIITKNLPQLLVELSNITLKSGCKSCHITCQLDSAFTKHRRYEPSTNSFANTTL
jgi:hypothetical protein